MKSLMAPCDVWGSTASRLEPLWGGSLLFNTKFPEIPGTHFMNFKRWKTESTFEPPNGFDHEIPELGIQQINH